MSAELTITLTQRKRPAILHTFPVRYTWTDKKTGKKQAWSSVCEGTDETNALNLFNRFNPHLDSAEIVK